MKREIEDEMRNWELEPNGLKRKKEKLKRDYKKYWETRKRRKRG